MAYYLQMDGVDDYVLTPSVTFNEVLIDMNTKQKAGVENIYCQGTVSGSAFKRITSGTDRYDSYWNETYIDGVLKAWNTVIVPSNQRVVLRLLKTAAASNFTSFNIFSNSGGTFGRMEGNLYSVKLLNDGVLVAHYDMTLGNVQDQSGNGKHATLTGGTWVNETSGVTHEGSASIQGVSTISAGAILIPAAITGNASLQGVGNLSAAATVTNSSVTASVSLQGVGVLTANGSLVRSANVNMIGVSALSVSAAGLTVTGAASFTGVGWLMAEATAGAQIISAIDIYGEYDFVLDIAGEYLSVEDTLGEMEPLTVDILGVIGMAIQNADISIYRGNDKDIRDTVKNTDGTPTQLSGASVTWLLKKRQMDTSALFEKSTPTGITITEPSNGVFVVHLTGSDTDIQHGRYFYAAKVTDALGKTTTVSEGSIVIKP